jgi:hypothetical protein
MVSSRLKERFEDAIASAVKPLGELCDTAVGLDGRDVNIGHAKRPFMLVRYSSKAFLPASVSRSRVLGRLSTKVFSTSM